MIKLNLELIGEVDDLSYSQESEKMHTEVTPSID